MHNIYNHLSKLLLKITIIKTVKIFLNMSGYCLSDLTTNKTVYTSCLKPDTTCCQHALYSQILLSSFFFNEKIKPMVICFSNFVAVLVIGDMT